MHKQLVKILYFGLLSTAFALATYWFSQPSVDDTPFHLDSSPSVPTQSLTRTIETNQESPASESRERESGSLAPLTIQVNAAPTVTPDSFDNISETDCAQSPSQILQKIPAKPAKRLPDIPAHLPSFNYHDGATDDELLERVSADDGYAQQVYATRLQDRLLAELPYIDLGNDDVRERWLREFRSMEEIFILAIQNRSAVAARILGDTLLMPTPRHDPVKAAAWLLIEQEMGGNLILRAQNQGTLKLTDELMETSELLAEHFIEDYDLWFLNSTLQAAANDVEAGSNENQECSAN